MKNTSIVLIIVFLAPFLTVAQDLPADNTRQTKAQKRFIHPKSKYFVASFGWAFTGNRINDPTGYSRNGMHFANSSFIPETRYEHGLVKNFFLEAGFANYARPFIQEWSLNELGSSTRKGANFFNEINIGVGYRIVGVNNFNFVNIHGGFFTAWSGKQSFEEGDEFGNQVSPWLVNGDAVVYQYTITETNNNHFGAYLGVSKDLRLSQSVLLFGKYTYRYGFSDVTAGSFDVFVNSNPSDYEPGRFELGLGGHFVTMGLKILIHKP